MNVRTLAIAIVLSTIAQAPASPAPIPLADGFFGTIDGVTVIDPASLVTSATMNTDPDGYLSSSSSPSLATGLQLPNGSEVFLVCVHAHIQNPFSGGVILGLTGLEYQDANPPSQQGFVSILYYAAQGLGYVHLCAPPNPALVVRARDDFDANGTPNYVSYRLMVSVGAGDGLGGIEVHWRRTMSPDPQTTTFSDVPLGNPFHQAVEALKAAGITEGCDATHYCPDAPVTRGQMAFLLARALGLHWPL